MQAVGRQCPVTVDREVWLGSPRPSWARGEAIWVLKGKGKRVTDHTKERHPCINVICTQDPAPTFGIEGGLECC